MALLCPTCIVCVSMWGTSNRNPPELTASCYYSTIKNAIETVSDPLPAHLLHIVFAFVHVELGDGVRRQHTLSTPCGSTSCRHTTARARRHKPTTYCLPLATRAADTAHSLPLLTLSRVLRGELPQVQLLVWPSVPPWPPLHAAASSRRTGWTCRSGSDRPLLLSRPSRPWCPPSTRWPRWTWRTGQLARRRCAKVANTDGDSQTHTSHAPLRSQEHNRSKMTAHAGVTFAASPGLAFSVAFHCCLSSERAFRRAAFFARRSRCLSSGANSPRPTNTASLPRKTTRRLHDTMSTVAR